MGFLTGGSKQKSQASSQSTSQSSSSNQAFPFLQQQLGGQVGSASAANTALQNLLGIGGDPSSQMAAFDRFRDSSGYQFTLDEGNKNINANLASRGLLKSGAAMKALQSFGQNTANQYFSQYLDRLLQSANQGYSAAQIIGGAGNQSQSIGNSTSNSSSSGSSSPGLGSLIGPAASLIAASDRRLKTNIEKIGQLVNGLPVYLFTYINSGIQTIGVMADEVRKLVPEALGPKVGKYDTVNYGKLYRKAA